MMKSFLVNALCLLLVLGSAVALDDRKGKGKGSKDNKKMMYDRMMRIKVTSLTRAQPWAPFFVMVHNEDVDLYEFGMPASPELAILAEEGKTQPLVDKYHDMPGVYSADSTDMGLAVGHSMYIDVAVNREYPLVTVVAMAKNVNDMFAGIKSERIYDGAVYFTPAIDAGSELNDEKCENVPGPACPADSGNGHVDGEGFVYIHPGIKGGGDLPVYPYDWKNPVLKFTAERLH
mmetsp:Transcript_22451/g.51738  ORF Transcript_22451/g.51738 Transcript_22451/m.51738 type:complete len:232 (-) Transcript_22451:130-825(-)